MHKVRRPKTDNMAFGKLAKVLVSMLLVICISAGCAINITGITGETDSPAGGQTGKVSEQDGNGDAGKDTDKDMDEGPAEIPALADEEIADAYQKAVEAFGWFEFGTMPADYEDVREIDGYQYNRVTHEKIKTYDDLKSYLQTMFTDEIVERLLAGDGSGVRLYRDIDGALYTIPAGRGSDIMKGEETYEIIRESDKEVYYLVRVEIYDDPFEMTVTGYENYSFPYEYIDGRWVFTHFELVR